MEPAACMGNSSVLRFRRHQVKWGDAASSISQKQFPGAVPSQLPGVMSRTFSDSGFLQNQVSKDSAASREPATPSSRESHNMSKSASLPLLNCRIPWDRRTDRLRNDHVPAAGGGHPFTF
eukprot:gnl/MRDRNA2_/MRDRNA2_153786_c0_seq1.p1 gnl/MRDRNA2_/MRDRNA2_153786_c0~~gnl/MRDRNA2_/MRDRNA2_153786_c0_seq1.p1  ORF type:complete len:120 (-),score=10.53 gnl/MRDRNA2_/MRDRNA2_153786_c0_seq1:2-361(-)